MPLSIRAHLVPLLLTVGALLSACGGGSSSGGGTLPSPPTLSNTAPVARIAATTSVPAGTVVSFDGSSSSDAEGSALTYAWTVAAPAGSTAILSAATTSRPSLTPDTAGTYTLSLVVNDGALNSSPATATQTVTAATPPAVIVDKVEPLEGSVQLSLSGTVSGSVTWYVDLVLLGNGSSATGNGITWNTSAVSNAQHLVVARIQTGTNAFQEVRRTVTVSNSNITLTAAVSGTTGTINVDVRASSTFGITRVSATLDGGIATVLTSPNTCSRFCTGGNDVFRFSVDAATIGSGAHTMVLMANDGSGSARQLSVAVPVSNAPVITLLGPADGVFAYGSIGLAGTATSDKPGVVTVTARLGDVQFLNSNQGNFVGFFDLVGVAPGSYTLTVVATDSSGLASTLQRTIYVTSTAALAYSPRFALPSGATLIAADGTQVLYSTSEGARVRDLLSGNEVTLVNSGSIASATDWQLSGGRAYVQGKGSDCTMTCIYQWETNGSITNLSSSNSASTNRYDMHPVSHGNYVLWCNYQAPGGGSYTLYDVTTRSYRLITPTAAVGAQGVGNNSYDFAVVSGVVHFYFWTTTAGTGTTSAFDIFKWQSDTNGFTRITNDNKRNIYPKTDGERVAWEQSPIGGSATGNITLLTLGLAGGNPATASGVATSNFQLRDNVLAWTETAVTTNSIPQIVTTKAVKASTAIATATLSALTSAQLYATGSGQVVFGELGKIYSWNSNGAATTLRIESTPGSMFVTGGAMIFTMGSSVYRVTLN